MQTVARNACSNLSPRIRFKIASYFSFCLHFFNNKPTSPPRLSFPVGKNDRIQFMRLSRWDQCLSVKKKNKARQMGLLHMTKPIHQDWRAQVQPSRATTRHFTVCHTHTHSHTHRHTHTVLHERPGPAPARAHLHGTHTHTHMHARTHTHTHTHAISHTHTQTQRTHKRMVLHERPGPAPARAHL